MAFYFRKMLEQNAAMGELKVVMRDSLARFRRFLRGEGGLVTAEWVALLGVALLCGVVMSYIVASSFNDPNSGAAAQIQNQVDSAASAP